MATDKKPGQNFLSKMYDKLKELVGDRISQEEFNTALKHARGHAGGKAKAEKMKAETEALVAFERRFAEGANHRGLMIAFYVSEDAAAQLAIPGGEALEDLHLTLCYLGDASQYSELALAEIVVACRDMARWQSPLSGEISGFGRFQSSASSGGLDVFYASVDVPGLNEFRADLARRLGGCGTPVQSEHGFDPHITLAYIDPEEPTPEYDFSGISLRFDQLVVKIGDRRIDLPMLSPTAYTEVADICGDSGAMRLFVEQSFAEPPEWFNYLPKPGQYTSPKYGKITITRERNQNFVDNFNNGIYQETIPIDAEHELALSGAVGYVTLMRVNDDGSVDAKPDWNQRGRALIEGDQYKYFSPSWYEKWTDPATGETYNDVAIGGALTNNPFFKEKALRPLVANERGLSVYDGSAENLNSKDTVILNFTALMPVENPKGVHTMADSKTEKGFIAKLKELIQNSEGEGEPKPEPKKAAEPGSVSPQAFAELQTKFTATEQRAQKAEDDLKQASERISSLEKERRASRFNERAKGWVGDRAKHAGMLEFISQHSEKGEESDEFKAYCESQDAAAKTLSESGLLNEIGGNAAPTGDSAVEKVTAKVTAMREKDSKLSHGEAMQRVFAEDRALYDQYTRETQVKV